MSEIVSIDTVNLEPFKEALSGDVVVPDQEIATSALVLINTLIENSIKGGAGTTFHMAEPTRYPTATISGVLTEASGLVANLDLIHPMQPSSHYWDLAGFTIPSKFPWLAFEIEFFPELKDPTVNVQREQIDIATQSEEYAAKQVADGLTSYLKLVRAREKSCQE